MTFFLNYQFIYFFIVIKVWSIGTYFSCLGLMERKVGCGQTPAVTSSSTTSASTVSSYSLVIIIVSTVYLDLDCIPVTKSQAHLRMSSL